MCDSWELICYTHKWMADNMPPIYDTHGIEMELWKEKNQPQHYLPEDHIYYEIDKYLEDTNPEYYYDAYEYENEQDNISEVESDTSESEYDDDQYY